ncbi:probable 2-oxoglutarate-dependent dioxygenase AOP1 [Solanum pennellii]|uniref:Probable 2-oxoglutarate-dependent dioxygenase AOP1 n=1 Tax=Solanum pennellii TaxID=28526 RepID=A0ABM1HQG5_SOLPN|nr:probable 2-oxoglutarate-dependent dioxygenase AOP1 [Solanum pennellii]
MKVPTIDFCKPELKPGTTEWDSTKSQVFKALQEYGCFEAIYDELRHETREAMFDNSKEIFEFPWEIKMKNLSKKSPFNGGYIGKLPTLPLYESVCIDDLLQPGSVETFADIFWPKGNPEFCNVVKSYSKPLVELDEMVKRMVLESLGLQNYIDEFLDLTSFLLRLTKYNATQDGDIGNKPGIGDHTDGNFLTIISQNQVNGLQILKKNGQWIDVDISSNSFVVLSGDSFMAWTNGRLHSPLHRVTMAGENDRFSIQLFADPKTDYTIKAPKELVDEEHPLLFKPYDILGYFEFFGTEVGREAGPNVLKAYCGV